ncbi:MAG: GNAT family N-acetyltransferase [Gemmatimonadetes bacterium]|nr:GNAT family N-acetyltransferase [Gemmatimonadota bacterium]
MSAAPRRPIAGRKSGVMRAAHTANGDVTVRLATVDDIDALVRMRAALIREHAGSAIYGRPRQDLEARARALFAEQLADGQQSCFVAERGGATVGCLRVRESRSSPLLLPSRYGYLSSAYVLPEERREGVLSILVEHALAWCRSRGLVEVRLHVDAMNDGAAKAWEALGFRVAEHLRHRVLTGG